MNIAYVHTASWPSPSPSTTFASLRAFSLAQKAQSCHFFIKRNSVLSPEAVYKEFFDIQIPKNLRIYDLKHVLKFSNRFYYFRVYHILKKKIRSAEIDCIITRNVTFLPFLIRLNKKYNIPVFFETHDYYSNTDSKSHRSKRSSKYASIEQKYVSQLTGLICLQSAQAGVYRKHYPELKIIIAGTGLQEVHKSPFADRKYITYIGSLDQHKGVAHFLKAVEELPASVEVLIIGAKNQQQVNDLKKVSTRSNLTILPWLKPKELMIYLSKTKIGILPLEATFFNTYLTSPLKLFDYFAWGIPVIASDLPSLRSLIDEGKTGLFFKHSEMDLAAKIKKLEDNKDLWNSMSEKVYAFAEERLWTRRAELLVAEIKKVC